jgi:3-oxoacyl-[acyl-carrier protein] reductase
MKLSGKVAVITGAASGIGRASALKLAEEGAAIIVTDIHVEQADKVVEEIQSAGGKAIAARVDVRSSEEINSATARALEQFGRVDILVNCAGGSARVINRKSLFIHSDEEVWDWVLDVNLKAVMICTKSVINHMVERGSGKIINFASVAGVVGLQEMVDYSAAKGGVIALTKALAMEVGANGVNVNCISPGMIASRPGANGNGTYLGRAGEPSEVANLVLFLASSDSDYITGQNYVIDGGRVLGPKL